MSKNIDLLLPASGKATRMAPLNIYYPKILLPTVSGTILQKYLTEDFKIFKDIFITYSNHDMFDEYYFHKNKPVFVKLDSPNGLGCVIESVSEKKIIKNDFMLLYGDCIYNNQSIKNFLDLYTPDQIGVMIYKVPENIAHNYSCIQWENCLKTKILRVISKPPLDCVPSNDAAVGYILPQQLMNLSNSSKNREGEYSLSNLVNILLENGLKSYYIYIDSLVHFSYPEDYYEYNLGEIFRLKKTNFIGQNVVIKKHVKIKNSVIFDGCTVDENVENSVIMPNIKVLKPAKNSIVTQNEVIYFEKNSYNNL